MRREESLKSGESSSTEMIGIIESKFDPLHVVVPLPTPTTYATSGMVTYYYYSKVRGSSTFTQATQAT